MFLVLLCLYVLIACESEERFLSMHYGNGFNESAREVVRLLDGGFLVLGMTNEHIAPWKSAVISRFSINGTLMWSTNPVQNDTGYEWLLQDAVEGINGGYFVIGGMSVEDSNNKTVDHMVFLKLSESGVVLWQREYPNHLGNTLLKDDFGNIVIGASYFERSISTECYGAVLKYSPDGESLLWRTRMKFGGGCTWWNKCVIGNENRIFCVGTVKNSELARYYGFYALLHEDGSTFCIMKQQFEGSNDIIYRDVIFEATPLKTQDYDVFNDPMFIVIGSKTDEGIERVLVSFISATENDLGEVNLNEVGEHYIGKEEFSDICGWKIGAISKKYFAVLGRKCYKNGEFTGMDDIGETNGYVFILDASNSYKFIRGFEMNNEDGIINLLGIEKNGSSYSNSAIVGSYRSKTDPDKDYFFFTMISSSGLTCAATRTEISISHLPTPSVQEYGIADYEYDLTVLGYDLKEVVDVDTYSVFDQNLECFSCGGIYWEEDTVCNNGLGNCTSMNNCSACKFSFTGPTCESMSCGGYIATDTENVCNGRGTCDEPETCTCMSGFDRRSYCYKCKPSFTLEGGKCVSEGIYKRVNLFIVVGVFLIVFFR